MDAKQFCKSGKIISQWRISPDQQLLKVHFQTFFLFLKKVYLDFNYHLVLNQKNLERVKYVTEKESDQDFEFHAWKNEWL